MGKSDSYYKDEAFRYVQEGYEKQTQGLLDEAVTLYKKSLEIFPTPEARTFLGWAYSFQGHYDEAIAECRKAIELDPEFGNPYNDIGAYLIETGKQNEAIHWLEKALRARRYESYCFPYYNLGRIWEAKGDWAKALHNYQQALLENPKYALAERSLNRVRGMMN